MFTVNNLSVAVNDVPILKDVSLTIPANETHILIGPNGAGKSTLSLALAGSPAATITSGTIVWDNEDITKLPPELRARLGLFLSFQHPPEIPGVSTIEFLRTAVNEVRIAQKKTPFDPLPFLEHVRAVSSRFGFSEMLTMRGVNEGLSGGEKKRSELLQLLLLEPRLAILDEPDSGLDAAGLETLVNVITAAQKNGTAFLIITHYDALLKRLDTHGTYAIANGVVVKNSL
ncbi:MAG: Fe-S cluster assembly ATPase SufC [Patescibacteria group bacterium]|jgi:Fe-S cluster assembly ATP-binding protein